MAFSESLKLNVKKKADFTCCWCQNRQNRVDIHHIVPQSQGGSDDEDNAAPLCGSCHDLYGNNPDLRREIRYRRDHWYEVCSTRLNPQYSWPIGLDVPLLEFATRIEPISGIPFPGIQFTDREPNNPDSPPWIYLSVYFKNTRYFSSLDPSNNEKWLYLEASMRPAFSLRVQVCAWNNRDIDELMEFLRSRRGAYNLIGHDPPGSPNHARDYLYVARENDENRLIMSTFTATNASISIQVRLSEQVKIAWANYLEDVGFIVPFND